MSDGYALTDEEKKALEHIPLLRWSGGPSRITPNGERSVVIGKHKEYLFAVQLY